jgi:hypothetical protein
MLEGVAATGGGFPPTLAPIIAMAALLPAALLTRCTWLNPTSLFQSRWTRLFVDFMGYLFYYPPRIVKRVEHQALAALLRTHDSIPAHTRSQLYGQEYQDGSKRATHQMPEL